MLHQVLDAFKAAQGPLSLDELARRLEIDRGALEGMIDFWVRKGRLIETGGLAEDCVTCHGRQGCPFVVPQPKSYALSPEEPT